MCREPAPDVPRPNRSTYPHSPSIFIFQTSLLGAQLDLCTTSSRNNQWTGQNSSTPTPPYPIARLHSESAKTQKIPSNQPLFTKVQCHHDGRHAAGRWGEEEFPFELDGYANGACCIKGLNETFYHTDMSCTYIRSLAR